MPTASKSASVRREWRQEHSFLPLTPQIQVFLSRRLSKPIFVMAILLAFLANGLIGESAHANDKPLRPAAFAQCTACHSTERGKNIYGPSLAGVAGRKAAALPSYSYSAALTKSDLVWNRATLNRWLSSPKKTVPGTRMTFSGISDPVTRKAVVDYLLTLN